MSIQAVFMRHNHNWPLFMHLRKDGVFPKITPIDLPHPWCGRDLGRNARGCALGVFFNRIRHLGFTSLLEHAKKVPAGAPLLPQRQPAGLAIVS